MWEKVKPALIKWAKYILQEVIVYLAVVLFTVLAFTIVAGLLALAHYLQS